MGSVPFSPPNCQALKCWCRVLWLCLAGLASVRGAVWQGELPEHSHDARLFVGKFVFDYSTVTEPEPEVIGDLVLKTTRIGPAQGSVDGRNGRLLFVIFDDEKNHWKMVRRDWSHRTCREIQDAASLTNEIDLQDEGGETSYSIKIREHIRPRFWYFALIGCDMEDLSTAVKFEVHTRNVRRGWQQEFSMDHMDLFNFYAVFVVLFPVSICLTVRAGRGSDEGPARKDHPYVKLLLLAYGAAFASCVLFLFHYTLFMHDGFGSRRLRFLGVLAGIIANCTMFLIAIMTSVGWAISTPVLPHRRVFLGAIVIVGGLNAVLELHAETATDLSTKLYSYQSGPGMLSLILKIFQTCWFCFQIRVVYEEEPQKMRRRFYKVMGIAFGVWSLHVPVTVLLAFFLAPYARYKVVTMIDVVFRFLGTALMSQLLLGPLSPLGSENTFAMREGFSEELNYGDRF